MTKLEFSVPYSSRNLKSFCSMIFVGILMLSPQVFAKSHVKKPAVPTAVCNHEESDGSDLGEHSNLCDANTFGKSGLAESMYGDIIFNRNAESESEKAKYIPQLYAFVREAATRFIVKKEGNPSHARIERFTDDIMAVAYHESRLTHYAYGHDKRFKLMAADRRLVSRGLMQINQTFHASRSQDNSLDIFGNITFGMDMMYANMKYIDESIDKGVMTCISKKEKQGRNYEDLRLRSAWSAYNSGSKFCRFRQSDEWSRNDKEFFLDFNKSEWKNYVSDKALKTKIDVACLENGEALCALPKSTTSAQPINVDKILSLKDGGDCLIDGSTKQITCVDSIRSTQCLVTKPDTVKVTSSDTLENQITAGAKLFANRDELCAKNIPGLIRVGEFLKLKKSVDMFDQVGGKVIVRLKPSNQVYQVIDYEIKDQPIGERFYKIASSRGQIGFIKAGTYSDFKDYVAKVPAPRPSTTLSIPISGSKLTIVSQSGLKVFKTLSADSEVLANLPMNSHLIAEEVLVKGSDNQIYVRTSSGYVYVGRSYLSSTTSQYVRME